MLNDFKDRLNEYRKYGYRSREDSYSVKRACQNLWIPIVVGAITFVILYFMFCK